MKSYPNPEGFFAQGVRELVRRLNSVGCGDNFIFVEFDVVNIDFILLSKFVAFTESNKYHTMVLIASENLLPLACLYMRLFSSRMVIFSARDPIILIIEKLSDHQMEKSVTYPHSPELSADEALIMECTLKGMCVYRISEIFGISIKAIYQRRRNAEKKLGVRKMIDLRISRWLY